MLTQLFLPKLSNLSVRNEFTDLLFSASSDYVGIGEHTALLSDVPDPHGLT